MRGSRETLHSFCTSSGSERVYRWTSRPHLHLLDCRFGIFKFPSYNCTFGFQSRKQDLDFKVGYCKLVLCSLVLHYSTVCLIQNNQEILPLLFHICTRRLDTESILSVKYKLSYHLSGTSYLILKSTPFPIMTCPKML